MTQQHILLIGKRAWKFHRSTVFHGIVSNYDSILKNTSLDHHFSKATKYREKTENYIATKAHLKKIIQDRKPHILFWKQNKF